MSTAPANVNEPTESVIATSDFAELKFNAFEALARLYAARGSFEPKPSSHVSSSTGGLDSKQNIGYSPKLFYPKQIQAST
jgi:hypothetical protein